MSLTQASDTENMQVKINSSEKQAKNGDEQIGGMSVTDFPPEFTDPAILVVREIVRIRYTKEELLKLRESALSKRKPDFINVSEVSSSIFDPERWSYDRKKSDTPTENGPRSGDIPDHRRQRGDPRERIRKENDGIVLSPQRRSFTSGCFVRVDGGRESSRRSNSPLGGKNEGLHIAVREIQPGTRRIGSGRILRDSWDFNEKAESSDDYNFRSQQRDDKFDRRDEKFERRSFGRDFDNNNKDNRRNGRYDRRRISENREQEEPEWFSGGPTSQNDTIELRGFEEAEKLTSKKKVSPSRAKRSKEWSKKKAEVPDVKEKEEKASTDLSAPSQQAAGEKEKSLEQEKPKETSTEAEAKVTPAVTEQSFSFDDILKCESIPGLLTNGIGGDGDNMKSRFSRWFKQESPEKVESPRSSMQDDHNIIKDLLKEITETNVSIPGDSEAYFAPISPAGNTGTAKGGAQSQSINIMDILQRGKQAEGVKSKPPPQIAGKILNLDEIEAKMRQNAEVTTGLGQKSQKPDEEMTAAFKKLLAQAQTVNHPVTSNGPISKTQPMSLLEMLNHSQQQDEAARMTGNPHLLSATTPNLAGLHHHPSDLTLKLQQAQLQQQQKQQMEMLNKLINATTVHPQQMRASPLQDMGLQQSRELLNRPEAQAILQGLKRGEITTQHLYQQLANPALQPRHREMLVTILKMQGGYGPSPRVLSPVPPHHMFQQQQQQQLRVSPLPPNAMHQRIPSPRELQVHTQNILQRALIKKKLEEQQENYRKKQELQRGQSPSTNNNQGPAKSVSSPTPLAFTPTSVLRKMTADKEEGKENKNTADAKVPQGRPLTGMRPQPAQPQGQQWNSQFTSVKQPAGRPIVKANNIYQGQTAEQFFAQQQQQQGQRIFSQPPPSAVQTPQQQQRKPSAGQFQPANGPQTTFNSQYPTNQQFNQQLTQQQLRAQHQHRPANQAGMQQQMGFQQQPQQQGGNWQQFFNSTHQANRNGGRIGRGGVNDGDLSPTTTNQLARWFSPDLLERARGGELPSTAGLAQHALSLEEIERQTAPPVHN